MQQALQQGTTPAVLPSRTVLERGTELSVGRLVYRLSEREGTPPLFFLCVCLGDEAREVCLGADFARAAALFDLLLRHLVTPCTLCDVLEDIALTQSEKSAISDTVLGDFW